MKIYLAVFTLFSLVITACGGGGGGDGGSGSISYTVITLNGAAVQTNVSQGASNYYRIDVSSGDSLTFTLQTLSGDADLAVFRAEPLDQSTLIDYSASPGLANDIVAFTATQTGTLYIEIGGFLASTYRLSVTSAGGGVINLSATPPASVQEGANFSFQLLADIPGNQGAVFTQELLYGPSGMQIDNTGAVSWVAHGAIFDTRTQVNYALRVTSGNLSAIYVNTVEVLDPAQQQAILRGDLSVPNEHGGIVAADFDKDGDHELLVTDRDKHVYLLDEVNGNYEQIWMLPIDYSSDGFFDAITADDLNSDGYPEIIIGISREFLPKALQSAKIVVIDGSSLTLLASREVATLHFIDAIEVADTDNDAMPEIIILGQQVYYSGTKRVLVVDAQTLADEWQSPGQDGATLAVGNLDQDIYPEIVTNDGHVYAFDGNNYIVKWISPVYFDRYIDITDIDNNGTGDIVTEQNVFSLQSRSVIWSIPQGAFTYNTLTTGNLDLDPEIEIVTGTTQTGEVVVIDYNPTLDTLSQTATISTDGRDITSLAVGQVDDDADQEIILGTNSTISTLSEALMIASISGGPSIEWSSSGIPSLTAYLAGAAWATLAPNDERAVFITPNTNASRDDARIVTLDSAGRIEISPTAFGPNNRRRAALVSVDFDSDSVDELFLSSSHSFNGFLSVYDFVNDITEWASPADIGESRLIAAHDLTGDTAEDIVTLNFDAELQVYDIMNDTLVTSVQFPSSPTTVAHDMVLQDIDGDTDTEIIFIVGDILYIYGPNGLGGLTEEDSVALDVSTTSYAYRLDAGDFDGDNKPEILVARSKTGAPSELFVLDHSLNILSSNTLGNEIVDDIYLEPASGQRRNIIVAFNNNVSQGHARVRLAWTDPLSAVEVMTSPNLVGPVQKNSLNFADVNNDSQPDMIIGTARGMYLTR